MSLVSVIMPAHRAQATIGRAVRSALSQTHVDLEVIVVADDLHDYARTLETCGASDRRVRHLSTGKNGCGAPTARNLGLAAALGDFVTLLDADDLMRPSKLERLLPLARTHGVAFDNVAVVDDATGDELHRAFAATAPAELDVAGFFRLDTPLIGVMRRDFAEPQDPLVEVAEDALMNLRLIDRAGLAPIVADALCEYRVVTTSICNDEAATERFERCYGTILSLLPALPLSQTAQRLAIDGFTKKRELNRAYGAARLTRPDLTFQSFVAEQQRQAPHGHD